MISVICDDDSVWRRALGKSLGGHVLHAGDIETALRMTKEMHPNVVLLDVVLPDGIGWEAIPAFRAASPHTEIVVMTALGRRCDALRAVGEHGAFAYLDKCEGPKAIQRVVKRAFISSLVAHATSRFLPILHPWPAPPLKRTA
jgi:DNA-binding NtrC family response regulator